MKISLTGLSSELFQSAELESPAISTVKELKDEMIRLRPGLEGKAIFFAVNNTLAKETDKITGKDRVLVFHPYAGG